MRTPRTAAALSSSRSSSRSSRSDGPSRAAGGACRPVAWRDGLDASAVLVVRRGDQKVIAPRVVRLLERIGSDGSVRKAAGALGLGYRHALAWICLAEETLGRPLVVRHAGGVAGGGAGLTLDGIALVRAYRRIDRALRRLAVRAEREILGGAGALVIALLSSIAGCGKGQDSRGAGAATDRSTLVVYNAGSLARPLRAALDSFAAGRNVKVEQENAGSLETARKLTELHKIPDVIALADYEVFPQLLMPGGHTTWYVRFARNRMVLAYTRSSRFAADVTPANWYEVLARPGVEVGYSDPNLDPAGYRTLMVLQLAERHYRQPGLRDRLLQNAPPRNVRPKSADLVALVQAGELDYLWCYESLAQATGLPYLRLPDAIDLGNPADSALYAEASVRVLGSKDSSDSVEFRGEPIVYGMSIPARAPHPELAAEFVLYLLSQEGSRVLRALRLDVLERPVLVGSGAPATVASVAGVRPST